ncbi:MAG TPA: methyl-accepting chemotaxis protein [Gammaproteobacteria bacterium]|nr:methyl-accepting chemotaxis protein [Gammaproteobacteria bacterium]
MFRNFNIGARISAGFALVLALVMLIVIPLVIKQVANVIREAELRELQSFYESAMAEIESKGQLAQAMSYMVASTPEIQKAFAEGDRQTLARRMAPVFRELKNRHAVRQFQFHTPPATSFLRVHKPEKFGDDLSSFRKTVLQVNKQKSPVEGLEKGVAGLGIRGLVPVNYQNRHIGSVEMGMSFGQSFFDAFKKKFNVDIALYVQQGDAYKLFGGTMGETRLSDKKDMTAAINGKPINLQGELNNTPVSVYLRTVNDFSGKPIGVLEIVMNSSYYASSLKQLQYSIMFIGFIALLAGLIIAGLIGRSISSPIRHAAEAMDDIAEGEGDLSKRLNEEGKDELGHLSAAFNRFANKVHGIVSQVAGSTAQLASSAKHMSEVTQLTTEGVRQQQNETEQVATAMNEMTMTVQQVAEHASDAAQSAQSANKETDIGQQVVNRVVESINTLAGEIESASAVIQQLEDESENIGSVLDVIRGIAEQTNLLALNAAIEAARAGEQGRGFAVVADEVRTLASRTQKSTEEIQTMIQRLQTGSREAVLAMNSSTEKAQQSVSHADEAGKSLQTISQAVNRITDMNIQIASAAEEQGGVANEINRNINNINEVVQQTAEGSQQISQASEELSQLSLELKVLVSQFKLAKS